MRLNRILPKVEPNEFEYSKQSPREGCKGMRLIPRQEVSKKIVGGQYPDVTAWRCEWDGGDAVAVGGKLRGGRNRLEGLEKNECVPGGSEGSGANSRSKARGVVEWIQDRGDWGRWNQGTLQGVMSDNWDRG